MKEGREQNAGWKILKSNFILLSKIPIFVEVICYEDAKGREQRA